MSVGRVTASYVCALVQMWRRPHICPRSLAAQTTCETSQYLKMRIVNCLPRQTTDWGGGRGGGGQGEVAGRGGLRGQELRPRDGPTVKLLDTWKPRTVYNKPSLSPCHGFFGPCHAFPAPCHAFPAPCHAFPASCHAFPAPATLFPRLATFLRALPRSKTASSEATVFWSFIFRSLMCSWMLADSPRFPGV